jgi:hypothetical protein
LVFAGYENSIPGDTINDAGSRLSLTRANTVEILDTQTKIRQKLSNLSDQNTYTSAKWDNQTGDIVYSTISKDIQNSGFYSYNLTSKQSNKIPTTETGGLNERYITSLGKDIALVGTVESTPTQIGNLGGAYAPAYTAFTAVTQQNERVPVPATGSFMQFITVAPSSYFADAPARESLQLKTFALKPSLVPVRQHQQSSTIENKTPRKGKNGTCAGLAWEICSAKMYDNEDYHDLSKAGEANRLQVIKDTWNNTEWNMCRSTVLAQLNHEGICIGSPLYLYGENGKKVAVKIHTPVNNDKPRYKDGYQVTLLHGGKLQIDGGVYDRIDYDYQAAVRRITQPTRGVVAEKADLASLLTSYAQKLGLNEKETSDLVSYGRENITSPYAFVSFFDQRTSEQILPLSFTPEPDTYLNIVFYFKQLDARPSFTPQPPVFPAPMPRKGFTAIEISAIVE